MRGRHSLRTLDRRGAFLQLDVPAHERRARGKLRHCRLLDRKALGFFDEEATTCVLDEQGFRGVNLVVLNCTFISKSHYRTAKFVDSRICQELPSCLKVSIWLRRAFSLRPVQSDQNGQQDCTRL
jgi:hypothetical protein